MDFLATLNNDLLGNFPPGIKIILSQLPLKEYSLLISFGLTIAGTILLIAAIKWNPPRHIPEGLKSKHS